MEKAAQVQSFFGGKKKIFTPNRSVRKKVMIGWEESIRHFFVVAGEGERKAFLVSNEVKK